ncbi:MAG: hypothetical protein DWQ36_24290 [Acidobacteria bacterium]|nr:MAG: hypothetical protein DWQ30_07485 [Acidobacteriota bacterium]REK00269.1 MAG: hypothetical protein DWQ36_24290 [Acidobacteriota bacterium]
MRSTDTETDTDSMPFPPTSRSTPTGVASPTRRLATSCILSGLLLGLLPAATGAQQSSAAPPGPESPRPHVLLLTVDTLRADHLSIYGSKQPRTPHIDALARRGLLFEDALTTIGKTGPAFASAFSSLHPPTHGARRNGVPVRDDVPLLAEILAQNGYRTAAFISNWTLRDHLSGLARGFDVWDEDFSKRRYGVGPSERRADSVIAATVKWTKKAAASPGPLLIWAHFSEPHTPYDEHDGFRFRVEPGERRTPQVAKRLRYASEVAYTDAKIGELLRRLESHIDLDRTLILFFADHGESIGEHDYWGHGRNVHWPNLDIPLAIVGPGVPQQRRSTMPASIIDVLPTVLGALRIPAPEAIEGLDLLQHWQTPDDARQRFAVADRSTALFEKAKEEYADPLQIAMQTRSVKTIFDFDMRQTRYYDLRRDPLELESDINPPLELKPPLRRRLANWYRGLPKHDADEGPLSEEDRKQLESLGYTGGR